MVKPYQQSLPFDELYAWTRFIEILKNAQQGESFTFYQWNRKFKFTKISTQKVLITSERLENLSRSVKILEIFEGKLMSSVLKDTNKHIHIYHKSVSKSDDWKEQIYRCLDPD